MWIREVQSTPKRMTYAAFEMWLTGQPRTRRVGKRGCASICPLAMWLKDAGIMHHPHVLGCNVTNYAGDTHGSRWPTPVWARKFIHKIDRLDLKYITAGRALEVLARCA